MHLAHDFLRALTTVLCVAAVTTIIFQKLRQPIVLGDFKMTPYSIPGHTPGSMGYIFQVKDNGKTRTAAIFGGTILTPGPISDEGLATYLKSTAHFKEETKKAKDPRVSAIRILRLEKPPEFSSDARGFLVALIHDFQIDVPAPDQAAG